MRRAIVVTLFFMVFAGRMMGQQHPNVERGFKPDKLYHFGEMDQVNVYNGNLMLRIPIGTSYPVDGGFSYGLTLRYDSKLWDYYQDIGPNGGAERYLYTEPNRRSNAGLGWSMSLGRLLSPQDEMNETRRSDSPDWIYESPDGSDHRLSMTLHSGDPYVPSDPDFFNTFYTMDGTYLRLKKETELPANLVIWNVEFPDGTIQRFEQYPAGSGKWRLFQIRDRFGNTLQMNYLSSHARCPGASEVWHLSDKHAREQFVCFSNRLFDSEQRPMVSQIVLTGFGASDSTYSFSYVQRDVPYGCGHSFFPSGPTVNVPTLQQITLPSGETFAMDYYISVFACEQGALKSVRLPTGGQVEYTHQDYAMPPEETCTGASFSNSNGIYRRIHRDSAGVETGRWTYTTERIGHGPDVNCGTSEFPDMDLVNEALRNTITSPLGHKTEHYFSVWGHTERSRSNAPNGFRHQEYSMPITREALDGSLAPEAGPFVSQRILDSSGTPRRTIYANYEQELPNPYAPGTAADHRRRNFERTVFHDDADRFVQTTSSDFDGFGHYRRTTTGGNFGSGDLRESYTNFNEGSGALGRSPDGSLYLHPSNPYWLMNLYSRQTVSEGSQTATTNVCFNGTNGFLRGRRTVRGGNPANDFVAIYTPDAGGNVLAEDYFGGDRSPLTTQDICQPRSGSEYQINHTYDFGLLKSSQYRGASFKHTDLVIDPRSGLVSRSRDAAGIATDYLYDTSLRLTDVRPQTGHGGWTNYSYAGWSWGIPAAVTISERANGSTTGALRRSSVEFDPFGRVAKESQYVPTINVPGGEPVSRITRHNAMGWKTAVSELEAGTPTHFTRFEELDPFGRPGRIVPPDSSPSVDHDIRITHAGVREVRRTVNIAQVSAQNNPPPELPATTIETYDRQGRLRSVIEPVQDPGVLTEYTYDVGNRLAGVCANKIDGNCSQVRLFDYDLAGLLRSETVPEKGVTGNGTVSYSSYDSRGHAHRRIGGGSNPQFDHTFVYDGIERLTSVSETSTSRLLKEFSFDVNPVTGYSRPGSLVLSRRYNYPPFLGGDWTVTEHLTYNGKGGGLSDRQTSIARDGTSLQSFSQTFSYTDLGQLETLGYPAGPAGNPLTIRNQYTEGLLSAVWNGTAFAYASSLRYHSSGMVHEILHQNGMIETLGADPSGMGRPSSIAFTGSASWNSGNYGYDGAGNISRIGNVEYRYDAASRLTSWTTTLPGGWSWRGYGYDPFGNRNAEGTAGCQFSGLFATCMGASYVPPPVDAATNHDSSWTYDGSGNVTSHWTSTYDYDGFDMMTSMNNGSRTFRYVYNAADERIGSYDESINRWSWRLRDLGNKPLRELTSEGGATGTSSWAWAKDYIYRGNQLLAVLTPSETQHFHLDHLGSPRLVTAGGGVQRARHDYEPFGAEETSILQNTNVLKFTAHERDLHGSGLSEDRDYLDYMHARYYNPNVGRLLSVDPGGKDPKKPQSWNRYAYALNNPIRYTDPDGKNFYDFVEGIGNGFSSSMLFNLNRVEPRNGDYQFGQAIGDVLALAQGLREIGIGSSLISASGLGAVLSGGTGAPLSVPAAAGGAVIAGHGAITSGTAIGNLVSLMSRTKGLENQVKAHEQKLEQYRNNPDGSDNKGFLKNATPEQRAKIIEARIAQLNHQIDNFKQQIRDILDQLAKEK